MKLKSTKRLLPFQARGITEAAPASAFDEDDKRPSRGVILHPTDYSEGSQEAFALARQIAQDGDNRLVVMHVSDPIGTNSTGMEPLSPVLENYRGERESRLGFSMSGERALPIEHRLEEGGVASSILRVARKMPCDLIVMSGSNRSRLGRLLKGSITSAVQREAPCPVLKLNTHNIESARRRDMLKFKTIIHPTDFSKTAMYAFELAQTLARASDSQLLIVHVTSVERFGNRHVRSEMYESLRRLTSVDPKLHMRHLLLVGDAATQIICSVNQLDCDLIVMGTHGHTGLKRLLLGSVARAVKKDAPCPVLTVQMPDQQSWELSEFSHLESVTDAEGATTSQALSLQANRS